MTDLVIAPSAAWLMHQEDGRIGVYVWGDDGELTSQQWLYELTGLAAQDYRRVSAILPMECVTATQVTLPAKNIRLFANSISYALEDELLTSDADQHYALGDPDEHRVAPAYVMRAAIVERLQRALADIGLVLDAAYVDASLLPNEGGELRMLAYGNAQWLCRAGTALFTLTTEQLDLLPAWIKQFHITRVVWHLAPGQVPSEITDDAAITIEAEPVDAAHTWLAQRALRTTATNVLQGRFAPANGGRTKAMLIPVTGMALAIVLSGIVYLLVMGSVYERRADSLHASVIELYQAHFPQSGRVFNVRKQVESQLRAAAMASSERQGFAEFISLFSSAWADADMTTAWVKHLRFTSENQRGVFEIEHTAIARVEALQRALKERGVASTVISASVSTIEPTASLVRLRVGEGS